eukprot:CAMPEP_0172152232 /NCGR_PEP_ID=MMETSP1050-20130122/718_1 /TAXON_ID=233186 /ORGANISM="Cryptomonas curvata, Strain CCAP979/52" /LENGTH=135 /DNA_ID=CAMNT_0012820521 /DNA_START=292 /DNA_END=695 /DNA_ORIENTATION=+
MGGEWQARIFVGGMKAGRAPNKPVGDTELRDVFGRFGAIKNIKSGLKDFVFIDYEDIQSCQRAIDAMNNNPFDSFSSGPMKVCLATPQAERMRRPRPNGDDRGPPPHRRSRMTRVAVRRAPLATTAAVAPLADMR